MLVQQIITNPDPYKPFRLSQGYRAGELLFISGQAAIDDNGNIGHAGTAGICESRTRTQGGRLQPRQRREGHDLPDRHVQL